MFNFINGSFSFNGIVKSTPSSIGLIKNGYLIADLLNRWMFDKELLDYMFGTVIRYEFDNILDKLLHMSDIYNYGTALRLYIVMTGELPTDDTITKHFSDVVSMIGDKYDIALPKIQSNYKKYGKKNIAKDEVILMIMNKMYKYGPGMNMPVIINRSIDLSIRYTLLKSEKK